VPDSSPETFNHLEPPPQGEWLKYSDDRRILLLFAGPVTDPVETLSREQWEKFELLCTERAVADAPELRGAAASVHLVPPGPVPESAAAIVDDVGSDRLVALGGGRVIDAAKGIAAVKGGEVAAIPTTLSGAPMTAIHRLPEGQTAGSGVRPSLVVGYADAMTSAPEPQLRATAMNALVCGLAVDRAGIALHHVIGQTAVRVLGTPHAETYAALLPETMDAMRGRVPEQIGELAVALGTDSAGIHDRIADLGGHRRLGELGADRARVDEVIDVAMARPELSHMTPGEVGRSDLEAILDAAW
jgi:alcohol dehydrogenase class IV